MNVRVTKFDRNFAGQSVCVGFYVSHETVDTGFFVDGSVPMEGTDDSMIEKVWIQVLPQVVSWLKTIQTNLSSNVGKTFSVPVVLVQAPAPEPAPEPAPAPTD